MEMNKEEQYKFSKTNIDDITKEVLKETIAYRLTSYYTGDSTGSGKCTASSNSLSIQPLAFCFRHSIHF